jgi:hypothetical protein
MGKIKITKSELDRIIKEEALKFKKAISLKKELANVEKELKQLNEVEAGKDVAPTGGDNLSNTKTQFVNVSQKAPKFHNPSKNPNTMMEDDADIEDVDMEVDSVEDTDGDTIDKAAVLSAIEDLKMALNLHSDSGESAESEEDEEMETNGEEVGDEDEEFEFDSEEGEGEEESEEDEEIEEGGYKGETHQDEEGNIVTADDVVEENLEEPIEGGSPIQKANEDDVNDNMEKDTRVKAAGDTLMESEKRRMAVLAGIMKG